MRLMAGALQAMNDLRDEAEHCEEDCPLDGLISQQLYPCNWIPSNAREPQREALLGAHNILLVIYIVLHDGGIPDVQAIREICEKEEDQLWYTRNYIACGGSVTYILNELTKQVESDMRGEAYHVESDALLEELELVRPCALDQDLSHWRVALGIE
ncbi:hypothetical protein LPJ71_006058 [Coemansia sp. S17]|nr:hypothetical protein LPJ71_006071 [Coemansia sp. S17]KAJ1899041.1 hypothetical protein LPJ71_006058 [Coemansia sp. S17]